MGATAVISGNDHTYERLIIDELPYFVNDLGGGRIYEFDEDEIVPGSMVRFDEDHGTMLIEVTEDGIHFKFVTRTEKIVDEYVVRSWLEKSSNSHSLP